MACKIACAFALNGKKALCSNITSNVLNKKFLLLQQSRFLSMMNIHYQRYFSREHEWIDVADNIGTVGITNYAQAALGELVYVELPEVDTEYELDDSVGTVESVKAASDVNTPVSGAITEVNEILTDNPALINSNPEDQGWMFKISLKDPSELEALFDENGYKGYLEETEE